MVSSFVNFEVDHLKKMMMNKESDFHVIFGYFGSLIMYRNTHRVHSVSEKLVTAVFKSSDQLDLRLMDVLV